MPLVLTAATLNIKKKKEKERAKEEKFVPHWKPTLATLSATHGSSAASVALQRGKLVWSVATAEAAPVIDTPVGEQDPLQNRDFIQAADKPGQPPDSKLNTVLQRPVQLRRLIPSGKKELGSRLVLYEAGPPGCQGGQGYVASELFCCARPLVRMSPACCRELSCSSSSSKLLEVSAGVHYVQAPRPSQSDAVRGLIKVS